MGCQRMLPRPACDWSLTGKSEGLDGLWLTV